MLGRANRSTAMFFVYVLDERFRFTMSLLDGSRAAMMMCGSRSRETPITGTAGISRSRGIDVRFVN